MIQLHWLATVRKTTFLTGLTGTLVGLLCLWNPSAWADYNPANPSQPSGSTGSAGTRGYTPPNPTKPRKRTGSQGTRGGCESSQIDPTTSTSLVLLAPQQHTGRTHSTHPTFVWYAPGQQSYPIELTLFEYGATGRGKPIQTFTLSSSPGLMQWTLPAEHPGLTVGQTYVWQVALICNPNHPSKNQWMEAVVEVVAPPASLMAALAQTTDPVKRAEANAEAGFWYDALAETFKTPTGRSLRLTFLKQLSQLEESLEHKVQLDTIIHHDRQSNGQ